MKKQTKWGSQYQCYFKGIEKNQLKTVNFDILCFFFHSRVTLRTLLWALTQKLTPKCSFQWVNYIFGRKNTGEFQNSPAGSSYAVIFLYIHLCWRHTASVPFKITNYFSPASPTFTPANQWLICMSFLLFWVNFILY